MPGGRHTPAVDGRHYRVEGRVQGVGYRAFAYREAQSLGLAGSVRNLRDGSVEVVAWGPAAALAELEARLREGPRWGRVERIVTGPAGRPPPGDGDFVIERDG